MGQHVRDLAKQASSCKEERIRKVSTGYEVVVLEQALLIGSDSS